MDRVFYHQVLLFVLEDLMTEIISYYYDDLIFDYFGIRIPSNQRLINTTS